MRITRKEFDNELDKSLNRQLNRNLDRFESRVTRKNLSMKQSFDIFMLVLFVFFCLGCIVAWTFEFRTRELGAFIVVMVALIAYVTQRELKKINNI